MMSGLASAVLDGMQRFEEFLRVSTPLDTPDLIMPRRRFSVDDGNFERTKNVERDDTIAKLKLYTLFGLLVTGVVIWIKNLVHDPNNNSSMALFFRKQLHWLCFGRSPRADAAYALVNRESDDDVEEKPCSGEKADSSSASERPVKVRGNSEEFSAGKLMFCVLGLLVAYICWGYFQERLMTVEYPNVVIKGSKDRFKNSEFLVFLNRVAGLVIASIALRMQDPPLACAPPYKFLFCSISNVLSAWFQYEALKFITFPMQVLAKSCKVLFTMLMGVAIYQKKFTFMEYINALFIALGLVIFKYGQTTGEHTDDSITAQYFLVGLILIVCYILCDSFTSNWQSRIFKEHSITSLQMMQGVNVFSMFFSLLTSTPEILSTLRFFGSHPSIMWHAGLMSACSGIGQLFIFYTIGQFGAVVFAVAMTIRLICSVLLSIIAFNHRINPIGGLGMTFTFFALVWRVKMRRDAVKRK